MVEASPGIGGPGRGGHFDFRSSRLAADVRKKPDGPNVVKVAERLKELAEE